jgi:hypothetical protein
MICFVYNNILKQWNAPSIYLYLSYRNILVNICDMMIWKNYLYKRLRKLNHKRAFYSQRIILQGGDCHRKKVLIGLRKLIHAYFPQAVYIFLERIGLHIPHGYVTENSYEGKHGWWLLKSSAKRSVSQTWSHTFIAIELWIMNP